MRTSLLPPALATGLVLLAAACAVTDTAGSPAVRPQPVEPDEPAAKPDPKEPQGVSGRVEALKGNFMPSPSIGGPAPNRGRGLPLAVPVHVFKGPVEPFDRLGPDRPKPLRTVQSNEKGVYRVALEPGEYTLVAEIKGRLYLNSFQFDAKTRKSSWTTVLVPKGKWVTWNIQDTSEAAF